MPFLPRAIHGLGIAGSGDTPAPAGRSQEGKYRKYGNQEMNAAMFCGQTTHQCTRSITTSHLVLKIQTVD